MKCLTNLSFEYAFITGFGAVMGTHTGGVLDYEICKKKCRMCDVSRKTGQQIEHDCRVNYYGSSKGMEAHAATNIFKRSKTIGLNYSTLIGDDDASTISRLRAEINPNISKISDATHAKRSLNGKLLGIRGKHKELTAKVISSIEKNFTYAKKQNEDDAEGLKKAFTAIPKHMFGDHEFCSQNWCGFLKDPNAYKHKCLPYGKPLQREGLKVDLEAIFAVYANNADKLCKAGSSQQNESLHNTIGSKCLKIRDYSSSASSDYRIAAGVAQKNVGYGYTSKAMEFLGLSPGLYTSLHAERHELKKRKSLERKAHPSTKRRRLQLKFERSQTQADSESREGCQYAEGLDLEEHDFSKVPDAKSLPQMHSMSSVSLDKVILYDTETTANGNYYIAIFILCI